MLDELPSSAKCLVSAKVYEDHIFHNDFFDGFLAKRRFFSARCSQTEYILDPLRKFQGLSDQNCCQIQETLWKNWATRIKRQNNWERYWLDRSSVSRLNFLYRVKVAWLKSKLFFVEQPTQIRPSQNKYFDMAVFD